MKYVILATLLAGSLVACDNLVGGVRTEYEDSAKAIALTPVHRDLSITAANAYSDIFLDSAMVDSFIRKNAFNDTLALQMRNFYNQRNYQFTWFASDGFTEQGKGVWNLLTYRSGDTTSKNLADTSYKTFKSRMDTLMEADTLHITASDSVFINTELALTQQFIQYVNSSTDTTARHLQELIPTKKISVQQLTDSMLNTKDSGQFTANKADSTNRFTANRQYTLLKEALKKYNTIAKNGGWQPVATTGKTIKKGTSSPVIASIKKRLHISGEWSGTDTSQVYNDSLETAIQTFQKLHGQKPDGLVTDSLIAIMNVPVEERMKQVLINLNRMAWMPVPQSGKLITVNIPDFMLHVYDGNQKAFDSKVVVGKEGTNTLMFTGNLNQVVFNPYWNIPSSIVKNEIMPALKKDPAYLKKHNMEIVHQNDSLPEIRQLPGPKNDLGKVKFLFPNTYDIYLHDSPAKELFKQENRAFSHGCIRVAEAQKLATYLLNGHPDWTPEKVTQAMNSGKEQTVTLKEPVPVSITYLTAWVDENGQLNFRNDIYALDAKTASKMFM